RRAVSKGKLLAGAVVAVLVGLAGVSWLARTMNERLSYRSPNRLSSERETPREQALRDQAEAKTQAAKAQKYEEAEYRRFPGTGSRVAIWMVAQLHLLFAAFVLAVPLFALIIEFIGYRT